MIEHIIRDMFVFEVVLIENDIKSYVKVVNVILNIVEDDMGVDYKKHD